MSDRLCRHEGNLLLSLTIPNSTSIFLHGMSILILRATGPRYILSMSDELDCLGLAHTSSSGRKYIRAHRELTHGKGTSEYAAPSHRESIRTNINLSHWEGLLPDINPPTAVLMGLFTSDLVPFFFGIRVSWSGFGRALPGLSALIMSGLLNDGLGETLVIAIGHVSKMTWKTVWVDKNDEEQWSTRCS